MTTPPGRHTVDTITSDQLDDLQDRLQRAEDERERYAAALVELDRVATAWQDRMPEVPGMPAVAHVVHGIVQAALAGAAPADRAAVDPAERRDRYAAAMAKRDGDTWPTAYENDEADYRRRADAAIAVANAEQAEMHKRALRAEAEAYQYRTALQGAARAAVPVPASAPADRAAGPAALREAAAFYEEVLHQSLDPDSDPRYCTAVRDIVMGLRRRADEAQPGAAPAEGSGH